MTGSSRRSWESFLKMDDFDLKKILAFIKLHRIRIYIAVLSVLLLTAVLLFFFGGAFRARTIEVRGNAAVSDERIIEEVGLYPGDHICRLDYGSREKRVMEMDPYIKDIDIDMSFPGKIVINVRECSKTAYIRLADGYAAVDDEMKVLDLCSDYTEEVRPLISGIDVISAVKGKKIEISNESDYQKMIIVLGAVLAADKNSGQADGYSYFENVLEVRIIPSGNIFLMLRLPSGSVLQVKLKSIDNVNEAMSWLINSITEVPDKFESLPDGTLDMTGDEYIYRPYN